MHDQSYATPRLGYQSARILVLWWIAYVGLYYIGNTISRFSGREGVNSDLFAQIFSGTLWFVGVSYGVGSGLCWLASAIQNTWVRHGVRLAIIVALALLVNQFATDDWLRNVSNLGGLVVFQCILFFLVGVPSWSILDASAAGVELPRRQFRIADVIIATTAIALLLAIVIRYATPIGRLPYWVVMVAVWWTCPLIAACLFLASLRRPAQQPPLRLPTEPRAGDTGEGGTEWTTRRRGVSFVFIFSAIALAAGLVLSMSAAEHVVGDPAPTVFARVGDYAPFSMGLLFTLAGFATAAWSSRRTSTPSA